MRKTVLTDGLFVDDLQALGYFARIDGRASSVVYAPISLPLPLTRRKPRAWRDTAEEIRGLFYHAALKSDPAVRGFTLRVSEAIEKLARAQGAQCLAWLHRRVVQHLRRAIGASQDITVPFWFALEEDRHGIHLHGEIAVNPSLEKEIRKALIGAGGNWVSPGRGYSPLRFERDPDFRWAGYCLKDVHKARPPRRKLMRYFKLSRSKLWLASFDGKAVTASEDLKRLAIRKHALAVAEVAASGRIGLPIAL